MGVRLRFAQALDGFEARWIHGNLRIRLRAELRVDALHVLEHRVRRAADDLHMELRLRADERANLAQHIIRLAPALREDGRIRRHAVDGIDRIEGFDGVDVRVVNQEFHGKVLLSKQSPSLSHPRKKPSYHIDMTCRGLPPPFGPSPL